MKKQKNPVKKVVDKKAAQSTSKAKTSAKIKKSEPAKIAKSVKIKEPIKAKSSNVKNPVKEKVSTPSKTPANTVAKTPIKVAPKMPEKATPEMSEKTTVLSFTRIGPMGLPPYQEQKGEEYMCKKQLDYFQQVLEQWKEQLRAERDATVQHMQDDAINFPDLLDRAALEEEHKLEWQTREREHRLIIKIEKAVIRIKQGDYGYCEKCGSEIGLLRLQVRPTATLCVDCKAIDEIREKQTGIVE